MSLQDFKPKSSAIQLPCKVRTVSFAVNVQDHVLRCRYAAEASLLTSKSEYIYECLRIHLWVKDGMTGLLIYVKTNTQCILINMNE